MATFTYFAKRQLKAGHIIDPETEYTITVDLQGLDGGMPKSIKKQHVALSGNTVTTLHRIEGYFQIKTDLIPISGGLPDTEDFDEFFHSVAAGETFVFNNGTDQDAIMASDPVRSRSGLYYVYSFRIRLL